MLNAFMILVGTASMLDAKVEPAPLFADNMVLQQNSQAAIWGKAEPNTQITISTTWSKAKVDVFSDVNGDWKTQIKTPQAGGPYEISITDGKKLTLKNVMIGEVWICMGQSNMDMTMRGFGIGVEKEAKEQAKIIRNASRYLTGEARDGAIVTTSTDNRRTYNQNVTSTIQVQQMVVRDEQDIKSLAVEIATLTRRQQRGRGLRLA